MEYKLKYGSGYLGLNLPDGASAHVFEPKEVTALADPVATLNAVLDAPIGGQRLEDRAQPASVSIAVPDETRPFPIKLLLPALLQRIYAAYPNLKPEDITIVVGGGLHPPADAAQLARIMPENLGGCRVVSHDAEHGATISFGTTSRGTPVEINADYAKAELRLVMGMVDPHQFVGFTGGSKGVTIGCASAAMIAANHRMMTDNAAFVGNIADNPVRQDLNESGEKAGIYMAINVVIDATKRPVAILAGVPAKVMLEASNVTASLYGLAFEQPYDIVVASCGGTPKDICLYQAQKGLNTATQCATLGAKILLVAECAQGIGDDVYYDYVRQFKSDTELMAAFKKGAFKMGAHKAFLFARTTTRFDVALQTALSSDILAQCLLKKGELQTTVDKWLQELAAAGNAKPRIAIIKNANSSFFRTAGK